MSLPVGDHVVTGTLTGVEARGTSGWMRYSILEPGNQYPLKVDTKKPEIIQACAALMGQMVSAQVTVQQSTNPNPHQPGTFYMNRYLNQIGAAGTIAQPAQQAAQPAAAATGTNQYAGSATSTNQLPSNDQVRELRIMRQSAAKVAGMMFSALPAEQRTPVGIVEASETLLAYFVYGPARFGITAFNAPPRREEPPHPADIPGTAPSTVPQSDAGINTDAEPCAQCGAVQGEPHAPDCIPF